MLEIKDVTVVYKNSGVFKKNITEKPAVNHVSLLIRKNEVFGLVGESGCGKTTIAKSILLMNPLLTGDIIFDDKGLEYWKSHTKNYYSKVQMIWQDPFSSLNPKMRIYEIIKRPLNNFFNISKSEIDEKVYEIVHMAGLSKEHLNMYPHELSGGGRQRVTIARALVSKPDLLLADEPTSSLDVSIQAQILNLLKSLQSNMQLSILFISHNLSVVNFLCDRIAVMYLGRIVEVAPKKDFFENYRHWYTKLLFESIPIGEKNRQRIFNLDLGEVKYSRIGCPFVPRCVNSKQLCYEELPALKEIDQDHYCACHFML